MPRNSPSPGLRPPSPREAGRGATRRRSSAYRASGSVAATETSVVIRPACPRIGGAFEKSATAISETISPYSMLRPRGHRDAGEDEKQQVSHPSAREILFVMIAVVQQLIAAIDHVLLFRLRQVAQRQREEDARERRMRRVERVDAVKPFVAGGEMNRLIRGRAKTRDASPRRG